jgi:tetratricopeptide (TPR) repeat protein
MLDDVCPETLYQLARQSLTDFQDALAKAIELGFDVDTADALDDLILEWVQDEPFEALPATAHLAHTYRQQGLLQNLAPSLNTCFVAHTLLGNTSEAITLLTEAQALARSEPVRADDTSRRALHSIANNAHSLLCEAVTLSEQKLSILQKSSDILISLGMYSDAVEAYCRAAGIFSKFGASQAAYRALHDAEQITHAHDLPESRAEVLAMCGVVAMEERDLDFAERAFIDSNLIYDRLSQNPPDHNLTNLGTVLLQKKDFAAAGKLFQQALSQSESATPLVKYQATLNLSVCARESGEHAEAANRLTQARAMISEVANVDDEFWIELELIDAVNHLAVGNTTAAIEAGSAAVDALDKVLSNVHRLHYRRNLRERFVFRLERILAAAPANGPTQPLMPLITFLLGNGLGDWLHLSAWCDEVFRDSRVSKELSGQLHTALENVRRLGAPAIFGFREKYDDPFDISMSPIGLDASTASRFPAAYSETWNELNRAIESSAAGLNRQLPFVDMTARNSARRISDMLDSGKLLLYWPTFAPGPFLLTNDSYDRVTVDIELQHSYLRGHSAYQAGEMRRRDFMRLLESFSKHLATAFSAQLHQLRRTEISAVFLALAPHMSCIPMLAALMSDDAIRCRLASGDLTISYVVGLCSHPDRNRHFQRIIGIVNDSDDLQLPRAEVECIARQLKTSELSIIDISRSSPSDDDLLSADVIHVAHHANPITRYTDPFFARLGASSSEGALSFSTLQTLSYRCQCSLVFLDACNSATQQNRNFQRPFLTSEHVGFVSVFLLNRRCSVVALQWATLDSVAYCVSSLFYESLRDGWTIEQSICRAAAQLYSIGGEELKGIYSAIEDTDVLDDVIGRISKWPNIAPLKHPFFYGAYNAFALL